MTKRIVVDGRVLAGSPSGVRDVTEALVDGLESLAAEGAIELELVSDRKVEGRATTQLKSDFSYMQVALPRFAARARASAIVVPRQTRPIFSQTPVLPLIHDIGFFRARDLYPASRKITVTSAVCMLSKQLLTVSEFTRRELTASGYRGTAVALPYGALHPLAWRAQGSSPYLACVAVQQPHKNLENLVRAWEVADTDNWRLVICAKEGTSTPDIERALAQSSKPNSVAFVSGLDLDEYQALLSGASGYIQPSLYEGLCVPLLDMASAGAPTLVGRAGSPALAFSGMPESALFDPASVEDISRSIELLVRDADFRSNVSRWNEENIHLTVPRDVAMCAVEAVQCA